MSDRPAEPGPSSEQPPDPSGMTPDILGHEREVQEAAARYADRGLTRRQISKRVGIGALTLAPFAAVLAACGSSDDPKDVADQAAADTRTGKKLAMFATNCGLVPTWYAQGMRIQKYYCDILGITYEYADGELDATKQRAKVENAASKTWDIVHIDANAPGTLSAPVKKMIGKGAVVIEGPGQMTRPGEDIGVTTWLHQSSHEMGFTVGTALFEAAGGKDAEGVAIMTRGPSAAIQVGERATGFKDAMKNYPGFKLVADDFGNWDPNKTQQLWEAYASRYKKIDVGYCQNDDMAFAAQKVMAGVNRASETKIGGCDAMPPAIKAVVDGTFVATYRHSSARVHSFPIFIGRALKMGAVKSVPRELKLDGPLVTKENAESITWLQQDNIYLI
jgi:ribose transport system substrate-binding protein